MTTPNQFTSTQTGAEAVFIPRSRALLAAYWLVFIISLVFAVLAVASLPSFEAVYQAFGVVLPRLTVAVVNYGYVLLVLPLIMLIPAILVSAQRTFTREVHTNCKWGIFLLLAVLFSVIAIFVKAIYLPIICLGQTV